MFNIIFQILILMIASIVIIFIKNHLHFHFLKRFKPIDGLLPLWIYFIYLNTNSAKLYAFLPGVLIPLIVVAIIVVINDFVRTGTVRLGKSLKFVWRISDMFLPLAWVVSIFIK